MDGRLRHAAGFLAGGGETPVQNTIFWRDIPDGEGDRVAVNSHGQIIVVPHGNLHSTDLMFRIEFTIGIIHISPNKSESLAQGYEDEWGIAETSDAGSEATTEDFTFTYEGTTYHYDGNENTFTPEISETYNP